MAIDLRTKWYRNKKDYWRAVREGRLPWPKYKKPVVTAIKLDPEQAIHQACRVDGAYFRGNYRSCIYGGTEPGYNCVDWVRGHFLTRSEGVRKQVSGVPS